MPDPTEPDRADRVAADAAAARAGTSESYDLVVIDTPPILVVSDAMPLISGADGVLAVSALGHLDPWVGRKHGLPAERLGVPVLGVVANFAEHAVRNYSGYAYGGPPTAVGSRSGR